MKRMISIFIVVCCLMVVTAYADQETNIITASGTCGPNLTWNLDSEGTLTISGTGEMDAYSIANDVPWYAYRKMIHTAMIGDDVESIGNYAFLDSVNLSNVTIGSSVKSIGQDAFEYCSELTEVRIPDSVTVIDTQAFYFCSNLKCVYIGNGVTNIKFRAFGGCARLERVYLGKSVTNIQAYAFSNCTALTDVYYNGTEAGMKAITIYGENMTLQNATWHCEARGTCGESLTWSLHNGTLTISGTGAMTDFDWYSGHAQTPWYDLSDNILHVVVEDGVTSVGTYAFFDNDYLLSVTLGDNVAVIGGNAFFSCDKLQTVTLGCRVAAIGECVFQGNGHLTDVYYSGYDMEAIRMDEYNASLRNASWHYLGNSVTLILPDNLRAIESGALANTAAVGIIIPASCRSIAADAFAGCTNLRWIINHSNITITPPAGVRLIKN